MSQWLSDDGVRHTGTCADHHRANANDDLSAPPCTCGADGPPLKHDNVHHPKHYTSSPAKCSACGHPIECIDVVEHMPFNEGNVMKYLWRAMLKGVPVEDLKKGRWYLDRAIAKLEGKKP